MSDLRPSWPSCLETIAALGLKVHWSIQLNELMKLSEYQRSRSFFDPGWKLKLVFLRNSWVIWNQIHVKAHGKMGMKIYTIELGHMTKIATMPIYGKNLKKSSSAEPIDRWPWNLVSSIVCASTIKVVQIMTLGWPWPISHQDQIWSHRHLYGKKWKLIFFANYCSLWSQSCLKHSTKWVDEVEYQRSGSFFDLGQRSLRCQS